MAPRTPKAPAAIPPVEDFNATPEEERLDKVLSALQGEGKVKVSRRDDKGNLRYVGTLPLTDDFSEETVREAFGGGRYSLRFFLSPDNDSYAAHMPMEIEGPARERPLTPVAPAPAVSGVVSGTGSVAEVAALHVQIARLTGLVEGMTAAMQGQGGAGGGGSLAALKDVAEVVRSLMPAPGGPGLGGSDAFAMAREALSFGRELNKATGDHEPGFPWEKVIDQGVVPLVELARKQQTPGAAAAAAPAAPSAPAGGGPDMAALPAWAKYLVAERGFVLQMARDTVDPKAVAALLLDRWQKKMPAADWDAFADATGEDGFADAVVELAVKYLPGVSDVRPWFGQFVAAVVADFEEDEPSAEASPGGGGAPVTS